MPIQRAQTIGNLYAETKEYDLVSIGSRDSGDQIECVLDLFSNAGILEKVQSIGNEAAVDTAFRGLTIASRVVLEFVTHARTIQIDRRTHT